MRTKLGELIIKIAMVLLAIIVVVIIFWNALLAKLLIMLFGGV